MSQPKRITEALEMQTRKMRQNRTTGIFDDLTDPEIYQWHAITIVRCGNELLQPLGKTFQVDDNNRDVLRFLTLYFNQCKQALEPEQYKDPRFQSRVEKYDLGKNLMLIGGVGTGKTLLMDMFSLYLKRTKNPLAYITTSVTEMLNYYKVNDHLDFYTYNCGKNSIDGNPHAICLNDVGLTTQKYYGNDLQVVIDEYFHARNEIYTQHGKRSHITTNLDPRQMTDLFADDYGRLADRWKTYNIIPLVGESRR